MKRGPTTVGNENSNVPSRKTSGSTYSMRISTVAPGIRLASVCVKMMGFSSARAGPPPRRNAVRTAMAIVRGRAVFSIDEEVSAPREIGSRCVTGAGACVFAPAVASGRIGAAVDKDWLAVLGRLLAGDRIAFLEVNRLVTGFLVQLRAYDFREEWDDLRQEVLLSVVANARAGRLRGGWAMRARARDLSMGVR